MNERLTQAHALPQRLEAAADAAAALVDEPGDDDRAVVEDRVRSSTCRCWPAGRSGRALMGVPGVANVVDLGAARAAAPGAGRPGAAAAAGRHARPGHPHHRQRAVGVAADLPRGVDARHRRLHRHRRPSGSASQHVQPIKTPQDLAKVTIERRSRRGRESAAAEQRLGDVANVVEDHQPLIGDAVFTDGPGLLLVVEKLPEANTLEVTRRARQTRSTSWRPASPASRSTRRSSGRRATSSSRSTTCAPRCSSASSCSSSRSARSCSTSGGARWSRWSSILALAGGGGRSSSTRAARRSTRWCSPGSCSPWSCSSTTRSSSADSDPAGNRSKATRRDRCSRVPTARWRTARSSCCSRSLPIFVLNGETGAFLPPLALSYAVRGAGVDARGPHRHPGAERCSSCPTAPPRRRSPLVELARSRGTTGSSSRLRPRPRAGLAIASPCCSLLGLAVLLRCSTGAARWSPSSRTATS